MNSPLISPTPSPCPAHKQLDCTQHNIQRASLVHYLPETSSKCNLINWDLSWACNRFRSQLVFQPHLVKLRWVKLLKVNFKVKLLKVLSLLGKWYFLTFRFYRFPQGESKFTWKAASLNSRNPGRFSSRGQKSDQQCYWKNVTSYRPICLWLLLVWKPGKSFANKLFRRARWMECAGRRQPGLPESHSANSHQGHKKRPLGTW